MKKHFLLACLLTLTLCLERAQAQDVQPLITGGFPINITEAPWQVFLTVDGDFICGGSIVAPNFILTARHCVENVSPSDLQVVAGVTCRTDANSSNTFNVFRIILHPDPNVDVALLQLSGNMTFNNSRRSINYMGAMNSALYNVGNRVRASGWGWTIPSGGSGSSANCLQAVDLNIISNQEATSILTSFGLRALRAHEMATAGTGNIRQGACHGDSGGPLTIRSASNEPVLIGIVARGRPNCVGDNANSPSVFERVSHVAGWIFSNTVSMIGPNQICTNASFRVENPPAGATVNWILGSGLSSNQTTGQTITVQRSGSFSGTSSITARVTVPGLAEPVFINRFDIYVGGANPANISSLHDGQRMLGTFSEVLKYNNRVPTSGLGFPYGITNIEWQQVLVGGFPEVVMADFPTLMPGYVFGAHRNLEIARFSTVNGQQVARIQVRMQSQCGWSDWVTLTYLGPLASSPPGEELIPFPPLLPDCPCGLTPGNLRPCPRCEFHVVYPPDPPIIVCPGHPINPPTCPRCQNPGCSGNCMIAICPCGGIGCHLCLEQFCQFCGGVGCFQCRPPVHCVMCGGTGCPFCRNLVFSPNPVSDILNIDLTQVEPNAFGAQTDTERSRSDRTSEETETIFDIRLLNSHGMTVRQQRTQARSIQFDVSNLPEGTYYLHIEHNGEIEMHQIIVQRN